MNQDTKNEQPNGNASVKSKRKKTGWRNSQGAKENLPKPMQTGLPKRKREPLQPTSNMSDHYRKRKRSVTKQTECYSMSNRLRGYCLIINNYTFERSTSLGNRRGTHKDKDDLTRVFEKMHFTVEVRNDLKASDMQDLIKEFASKDHSQMDAFVCCVLSHGEKGTVLGIDGIQVPIRDLTQPFAECHTLASKPKLFFIQACQGEKKLLGVWMADGHKNTTEEGTFEEDAHTEAFHSCPIGADFLIGMATVEYYKSFRHTQEGSIFIQELCRQLEIGCPRKEDMHSILTKVNRMVSSQIFEGCKQMPEVRYTLTKTLVLPMKQVL
ncbi:caspase 8, apoptosis-related cysteine peptidase, like 1 isoform X1 [Xyrauchen texanus]|uniref:caspase 8, apoptosis-related cysteine peptidase, like 1 isoform X1 n=1 Tax=Xyrauchen texanus TaxID=154827 RepID=UPI002241D627|nr:caspase 8, apoptosis-related cysteine peptidase, like 1 isoform X1 [Xyrauchen texanus]